MLERSKFREVAEIEDVGEAGKGGGVEYGGRRARRSEGRKRFMPCAE